MIIGDVVPSGRFMAGHAVGFRIKFRIDLSFMNILVTIHATNPDFTETPVPGFPVTGDTGGCQVPAFEPESSLVVLIDRENNLIKTIGIVTIGTVCHNSFLRKLMFMVVFMTIGALRTDLPEAPFFSFLMTFNTWGRNMSPFENELALVMLIDGKGGLVKPFCTVTIAAAGHQAIVKELPVVIILMAIGTLIMI